MSNENFSQNPTLGGRRIKGGNPTDQFILKYNDTTKLWEFTAIPVQPVTIGGKSIEAGPPLDGEILQFNSGTDLWEFVTPSTSMSEVEFLQSKSAASKLRNVTGNRATPGVILTITPPAGVTTVIYEAGFSMAGTNSSQPVVELIVNAVTIEQIQVRGQNTTTTNYWKFLCKGLQLVGDGAKTITINISTMAVNDTLYGNIEAYDL